MNLLVEKVKTEEQPFLAGDHTFWPRPDAKTLKERTFNGRKGVGVSVGQSYSTLAWIPEADETLDVSDPKVGQVKLSVELNHQKPEENPLVGLLDINHPHVLLILLLKNTHLKKLNPKNHVNIADSTAA